MGKNHALIALLIPLMTTWGCKDNGSSPISADDASSRPSLASSTVEKEGPFGECPDFYYVSTKVVDGDTVRWTSSFARFDYTQGSEDTLRVWWSVSGGGADFIDFYEKKKPYTPPKHTHGTSNYVLGAGNELELFLTLDAMHRWWGGSMGNAHFMLELNVNNTRVKLGVNAHMEDPDEGVDPRCPEGSTVKLRVRDYQ